MRFLFFRFLHPFLSKCMQRMRKRRKSNLILIFFDGRKFRRQCANVIDTTWGRIYLLTCENFRLSVQRPLQSERRLFACSTGESGLSGVTADCVHFFSKIKVCRNFISFINSLLCCKLYYFMQCSIQDVSQLRQQRSFRTIETPFALHNKLILYWF